MDNKEVANTAVTGLVGLMVAPIVVGVVVKSAGKCYSKIANEFNRIKYKQGLRKEKRDKEQDEIYDRVVLEIHNSNK